MEQKLLSVVLEDIAVTTKAFTMSDFEMMNICGNRIMSNALFGDDARFALTGFFVKQVALTYLEIKAHFPSRLSTSKTVGKEYINTLTSLSGDTRQANLWQDYNKFCNLIRHDLISDEERTTYSENPDFSALAFRWLVDYLSKERDALLYPRSVMLKGILNEMGRIYNVHGAKPRETYICCLVIALDRYFDYFRIRYGSLGEIDYEALKKIVFPYIDKLVQITDSGNEPDPESVGEIILSLTKMWRLFFIHYMELSPSVSNRPIKIPEESKSKLAEAIGKALEREAKT